MQRNTPLDSHIQENIVKCLTVILRAVAKPNQGNNKTKKLKTRKSEIWKLRNLQGTWQLVEQILIKSLKVCLSSLTNIGTLHPKIVEFPSKEHLVCRL